MKSKLLSLFLMTLLFSAAQSLMLPAQTAQIPFGEAGHDTDAQVEIAADGFILSQNRSTAVFNGNVVVGQGDMRLAADKIVVEYASEGGETTGKIGRLVASGGVTLVSGQEAAEAQNATYSIALGVIVLDGDVLLTQGNNALSGQKMTISLAEGTAIFEGRVKTVFQTGGSQ